MVNLEAERKRLQKELEQSRAEVAQLEARLKDREFLTKAPPAVVAKEQDRLAERKAKLQRLKQQLNRY
jgi:valyl-tRNA synthetase